jgi:DNA-binding MarR family transcriptional regulator
MSGADVTDLQRELVAFVRAFGLHKGDETPCGAAVPVSEAHALTALADAGGLAQSELAAELALRKSTVSRLVDQLAAKGWVERRGGQADGRRKIVELTPAGADVAAGIAARRADRMGRLLDRIPEGERAGVVAALGALVVAARAGADDPEGGR